MDVVELEGFEGRTFHSLEERRGSSSLLLVFPGYVFEPQMAVYQLIAQLARQQERDLVVGRFGYDRDEVFDDLDEAEGWEALGHDAAKLIEQAEAGRYARVDILGKSLGTQQVAWLLDNQRVAVNVPVVWLTPTLQHPQVLAAAERPARSLWVQGTADPHWSGDAWDQVVGVPGATGRLIPHVGHGLDVPDAPRASLAAWEVLVDTLEDWWNPATAPPAMPRVKGPPR